MRRIIAMLSFGFFLQPLVAEPADFQVNSTIDEVDANPGDGNCATATAVCTLRAAIQETNALPGADTIQLPVGNYGLSIPREDGVDEEAAARGDLDINDHLTITGERVADTVIDSADIDRIFDVGPLNADIDVNLSNLSLTGGSGDALEEDGGGVANAARLVMTRMAIFDNGFTATGTGFYNEGTATVTQSSIFDNRGGSGAGVFNRGRLTMTNSTVADNQGVLDVGGLVNAQNGEAMLNNVTLVRNRGLFKGGIDGPDGSITIANSIVALNRPRVERDFLDNSPDCDTVLNSQGHNIILDPTNCGGFGVTDRVGEDPLLDAELMDNGGGTPTFQLLLGSPAVDNGNPETCEAVDQRGRERDEACDIGAFERALSTPPDHFLCYKAKITRKTDDFTKRTRGIVDAFENRSFEVRQLRGLCNPADKNGEGIDDPQTHLVAYQLRRRKDDPKHERRTVRVENQFGAITVDTKKPSRLLMPSSKDLSEEPPPPDPAEHDLDAYKCYRVKLSKGSARLPRGTVASVADQFTEAKRFQIGKPTELCNPAIVGGRDIKVFGPDNHLMCYKVRPLSDEPKHDKRSAVRINNRFEPSQLDTKREQELCVPSVVE